MTYWLARKTKIIINKYKTESKKQVGEPVQGNTSTAKLEIFAD